VTEGNRTLYKQDHNLFRRQSGSITIVLFLICCPYFTVRSQGR
jgi:hypothetical protein